MSSSKLLKERIESIQDTMKITNAMYLISSSKLRKARQNYQNVSPYFNRMRNTISRVVPHLPEEPEHPFFHERNLENPRRAYLVLTADKGMAGAYNQNLLKFLREHADTNDRFYVIGQVGYRALHHRDPRLVEEFRYSACTYPAACPRHHSGRYRRFQVRQAGRDLHRLHQDPERPYQ